MEHQGITMQDHRIYNNHDNVTSMMYERDDDDCCEEAEDFMCDQVIFSADVDFQAKQSSVAISTTKLRVAIEIVAKALLPTVTTIYYAYMRNQKSVVDNVRKVLLPTVLAVLANYVSQSLSSVQRRITAPRLEAIANANNSNALQESEDDTPEKSVECNVLTTPQDIKTDIIFIHGLHGALEKTWKQGLWRHERHKINRQELTKSPSLGDIRIRGNLKRTSRNQESYVVLKKISKNSFNQSINNSLREVDEEENHDQVHQEQGQHQGQDDYSPCWPLWLEKDYPGARVIALNYTTDPYLWRPIWVKKRNRTNMVDRSKEMIEKLREIGVGAHPIVWVGHSKGGLFIKQILVDCCNAQEDRSIYEQSKGILFYSVPHRGSLMADISLPLLSKSIEVTEVQRNCKFVLELHDKFLKLFEDDTFKPEVFSFIESSFTLMSFIYLKIVSIDSADPGVGEICEVPLDHREICKPAGRDCFLYKELVHLIDKSLKKDV